MDLLDPECIQQSADSNPWGPLEFYSQLPMTKWYQPVANSLHTRQGLATNKTRNKSAYETADIVCSPQQDSGSSGGETLEHTFFVPREKGAARMYRMFPTLCYFSKIGKHI